MRLLSLTLLLSLAAGAAAQYPSQQYVAPPPPPVSAPAVPVIPGPDAPSLLANLADEPATHTGVTFDRNEMQLAQSILQANGMDAKRAAAAITGLAFDTYHYQRAAFYTPETMNALLEGYKATGWKHLVNANQTAANTAQPARPVTDVWLHFSGTNIDAVTVLTRAPKTMNLVRLTGELRPLDLLHLSGKFGIPKVDPSAVMVPERN